MMDVGEVNLSGVNPCRKAGDNIEIFLYNVHRSTAAHNHQSEYPTAIINMTPKQTKKQTKQMNFIGFFYYYFRWLFYYFVYRMNSSGWGVKV